MQITKRHNPAIRMEKILTELGRIFDSAWFFVTLTIVFILNFLAPVKFNLTLIAYLIFADVVTALIALFMQKKREQPTLWLAIKCFWVGWTSKRAGDSLFKFMFYLFLILAGYYVGKLFENPDQYARVATAIICYVEITSIVENGDKAFNTNMLELAGEYLKKLLPGKK